MSFEQEWTQLKAGRAADGPAVQLDHALPPDGAGRDPAPDAPDLTRATMKRSPVPCAIGTELL
ncbi:hypothetical protein DQ392_21435 [Streptomyces reniochalinae]|uniref:Uncharacterized protein n=1 Tax=Streptomyces reniochalinae TaxID=2250578 RepID=A0A367EF47_9ACTN|nr:hypothetical protein DQ392_21435 [Streptomyces reniochalinae]